MEDNMEIRNFQIGDISDALHLCRKEGWISGIKEFFHILTINPNGSFVLARDNRAVGFITTYTYGLSAWIGNFVVAPSFRGMGYGTLLFENALNYLKSENVLTIYLTADSGAVYMYKKYGFQEICLINRWQRNVLKLKTEITGMKAGKHTLNRIINFDRRLWQEDRTSLIKKFWSPRNCFENRNGYGFIIFNKVEKYRVIGPWEVAGKDIYVAEKLLKGVFNMVGKKETLILDVPKVNMLSTALLTHHGFNIKGTTTLMYKGFLPDINFDEILAMGSLGSIG